MSLMPTDASRVLLMGVALLFGAGVALADNARDNPWQRVKTPATGTPRAIGDYSAGCVQGAQALPLSGDGFEVMHPSRLRYFGHPQLVDFIETLGRNVRTQGLEVLLVGDLSQPRGGRAPGGHASHQTGLDVDLWYWHPKPLATGPDFGEQRERLHARSVLDPKTSSIQAEWSAHVAKLLELAASDQRVERIFVHPIIKRELCKHAAKEHDWLGKIRPWYGHDDHFHVRLACPADSPDCMAQAAVKAGDGCEEVPWWFSPEAQAGRDEGQKRYQSKVAHVPTLPAQCKGVLAQK
jgi:penicillin-insensitive murein endopeptidase